MKRKEFIVNGATILVLQVDRWLVFSMQLKSQRLFHCTTYKGKIGDVTEEDAIEIWNQYHVEINQKDEAWRERMKKRSKRRKSWRKRKESSSENSEQLIREIRP